ncbi:MAG: anti-sigma factor family protein [Bacillota bacterium]
MEPASCPGRIELEGYFYGELSPVKAGLVKYHLSRCSQCRQQLEDIKRFDALLRDIPLEEPPPELSSRIIASVKRLGTDPAPRKGWILPPLLGEGATSVRIRWAATAALILLNFLFRKRLGLSLGLFGSRTYTLGWADLRFICDQLASGALWANLKQVLTALRANGLFALEVIGNVLPRWFPNVLIVTGFTLVVWIAYLVVSRSEGRRL